MRRKGTAGVVGWGLGGLEIAIGRSALWTKLQGGRRVLSEDAGEESMAERRNSRNGDQVEGQGERV